MKNLLIKNKIILKDLIKNVKRNLKFKKKSGIEGFEPSSHRPKNYCLTTWLYPNLNYYSIRNKIIKNYL